MTSSRPIQGKSLGDLFPDLARQWHPSKNGDLTAFDVTPGSAKKVWWLGECNHEWDAPPTSRTLKRAGCPICTNKRVVEGINDLGSQHPELAREWHPTKNEELTPAKVSSRSSKRVWWLAACGHEWDVSINDRVHHSTGCPYCNGNLRVLNGINDLATVDPELAREWHPTKNGMLRPTQVKRFSVKKVWWLGKCGHEWLSTIAHRSSGRQCPYCLGKKILQGFNDLATTHPELAKQWHPTRNGEVTPEKVSRGSDQKVWWSAHGHEWVSTISSRTSGAQGCAICTGDQVQIGVNDLLTTSPEIAARWHPDKNGEATPTSVTSGSSKRFWWLGECGHSWQASVNHLVSGRGCAVCRGLQIEVGVNDLESQYPNLAAQWHPTKNQDLTPQQVTSSSAKKVWWICEIGHEWRTGVNGRKYGEVGCPSCADYGYSPSKDGWLYFLFHPVWKMQQIGISNVPESRLAQHRRLGWQIVEVRGPMDGPLAQALEQEALGVLRKRGAKLGIPSAHGSFDGHTEAWPIDSFDLKNIKQLLDWVYEDDSQIGAAEHLEAWTAPTKRPKTPKEPTRCKVEGCARKHNGFGFCKLHYRRWIKSGDPGPLTALRAPNGTNKNSTCAVEGCNKTPVGRGLCSMHHRRLLTNGNPGPAESSVTEPHDRICIVDGCTSTWSARQMCEVHYRRYMSNGDPTVIRTGGKPKSFCSLPDCDRPAFGLGYCNMHYKRFRKYGDPNKGGRGN